MTNYTHAIIFNTSPFQNDSGKEALELALTLATYEQPVSLFFKEAGVLQLLKDLSGEQINKKNFTDAFKALELYDIHNVYVLDSALTSFNLTVQSLNIEVRILTQQSWHDKLHQFDRILNF